MTSKNALWRSAALGVLLAAGLGAVAQAQTRESADNAELAAQIQALRAQVQALQARLDAQEEAQARSRAQADAAQAQVTAAPAEPRLAQEKVAAGEAAIAALPPPPAYTVAFDGGPRISGGGASLKIRGRLLIDATAQHIDRSGVSNDFRVSQIRGRQAFLGVEGNIGPNWYYKLEGGAVNGGGWSWDDALIEYRHDARNSIIIGNQKGFGLENLTSTRFTSFLDRGPMDTMIDGTYQLGAYYWRVGRDYSFNVGVTGHTLNSPDVPVTPESSDLQERFAASTRVTFAPVNNARTSLHLGGWARYRKRGDDGPFLYTAGYNSPLKVQTLLSTGAAGDHDMTFGLEGAWIHDSLSVQGEWANVSVDRVATTAGAPDFKLRSGYAFISFFPTGERRTYAVRGEFGRTRVLAPLSDGGWGALELLARYDFADFTDAMSQAGVQLATAGTYRAVTLGANWSPISYVRFMANYTRGRYQNIGTLNDADVDLFQVRGQIDW